jgi:glyoxylase-like metal-dependent hydrolase (beta-lactamase superfamily II)
MIQFNPARLTKWLTCLAISTALSACTLKNSSNLRTDNLHAGDLRLYVLDCGYMDMQGFAQFEELYGVPETAVTIPGQANPCFLITNNGQSLLWESGLPDATPREPTPSAFGVNFEMPNKLKAQMEALGVPPANLDYFAISHLHFDHIGNGAYFKHVKTLLQLAEWAAANRPGEKNIGYDNKATYQFKEYEKLILLAGDHDVFGDGLVTLISAPGHTEGHQVLVIKLREYGPVILSGDAIHFTEELQHHILPTFNASAKQSEATLKTLLELETALGGELWIQHDPVQHQKRKMAPDFYR